MLKNIGKIQWDMVLAIVLWAIIAIRLFLFVVGIDL